ncbi:MAG TPA: DinB family protein [Candidatus Angelobacter sp.]|nr:DinB family protein [Candidatus Angelobacter sp.]
MKHVRAFCLVMVLAFAISAFGQAGAPAKPAAPAASPAPPQAQSAPPPIDSFSALVDRQVSQYEKNVVEAADAMPAEKFDFTPASLNIPGSSYKDVRTFAQLVKHTATANYRYWTTLTGEKMPENIKGPNGPDELKTKAEIMQFLKDSFAVGHRAAKTVTPQNALELLPFFRGNSPRLLIASGAVIHAADEYGQMVEYLRMNGIVPPASRPQQ